MPAWFRSLRLHKYNNIFEPMKWQDIVKLSDEDLIAKGVAALGARRKMLKVFETVRQHCEDNVSHFINGCFQKTSHHLLTILLPNRKSPIEPMAIRLNI